MEYKKIAVFIDSDNTPHSKLHLIIEELSGFGKLLQSELMVTFQVIALITGKTH